MKGQRTEWVHGYICVKEIRQQTESQMRIVKVVGGGGYIEKP